MTSSRVPAVAVLVLVVTTGLLLMAVLAPVAAAHPFVEASNPAPGESLPDGARVVVLEFGEAVDPASLDIDVVGESGRDLVVSVAVDPHSPRTVRITTEPLASGTYTVRWSATSTDGHPASGRLQIGVGTADAGTSASWSDVPGGLPALAGETLAEWALLVGLLVTVGLVISTRVIEPGRTPDGWLPVLAVATALALVGELGVVAVLAYRQGDIASAVGSTGGSLRLVAAGLIAAGCLVATTLLRTGRGSGAGADSLTAADTGLSSGSGSVLLSVLVPVGDGATGRRRSDLVTAVGVLALAALVVDSLASHGIAGASVTSVESAWVMLAGLVHVLGASVWLGGLVGLALIARRNSRADALAAARRFSPWGFGAVVAIGLSGLVYADAHLLRWSDLVSTTYGGILLVKAGVIVIPLAFAAYHRYRVLATARRHLGSGLRRSVPLEAISLALIVGLAALLAAHPRPAHPIEDAETYRGLEHEIEPGEYRLVLITPDPPRPGTETPVRLTAASKPLPGLAIPPPTVTVDPPGPAGPRAVPVTPASGAGQGSEPAAGSDAAPGTVWQLPDDVLASPGTWTVQAHIDGPHGPVTGTWRLVIRETGGSEA